MDVTNAWGSASGVLHASPVPPNPTPTGNAYVALCGTTVRNVTRIAFTPGAGRCGGCMATVMRVRTLMAMRGYDQVEFDL